MIIIFFTIIVACIVMATMTHTQNNVKIGGAAHKTHSPHIVIDMLNLTHAINSKNDSSTIISPEIIAKTIDATASTILAKHNGRVMYVVKDRDSQFNNDSAREIYKQAAERNGVYVYVVERYQDPANTPILAVNSQYVNKHSSSGRDDLFMAILAQRWKCTILTEDRLRDFDQFRTSIYPFHVYEFAFWRAIPYREFINPMILQNKNKLKKPKTTRLKAFFNL